MKVNIQTPVLDYEGKPVKEGENVLTFRRVLFSALNVLAPDENMSADDKEKAYRITTKAYQSDEPNYNLEERNFILQRIKRIYNPLVCGRATEFFETREQQATPAQEKAVEKADLNEVQSL